MDSEIVKMTGLTGSSPHCSQSMHYQEAGMAVPAMQIMADKSWF